MSADVDPAAVERNYRRTRSRNEIRVHPLWIDLRNPSPSLGWAGEERDSLVERSRADMVLALALVHHLAIGANVPLTMIVEFLSRLARELVVEFVPKDDPQAQRLLTSREDIFDHYDRPAFESALESCFFVLETCEVGASGRVIYRARRRRDPDT